MTASTAISEYLITYFDGEEILTKHALYWDAKAIFGKHIEGYLVFAGVRNPLDTLGSYFAKMQTNHR